MIVSHTSNRGEAAISDTESLDGAVSIYGKQLTSFAFSYVKDWGIAEDIVQDVFIKALRNYESFRGESSLKTWLYSITANQCKDYLKSSYFKRVVLSNVFPSNHKKDEYKVHNTNDELSNAIFELSVKYREVIMLYYYEGLRLKEIASLLQLKEATVKTRLQRARTLMRGKLEGSTSYEG